MPFHIFPAKAGIEFVPIIQSVLLEAYANHKDALHLPQREAMKPLTVANQIERSVGPIGGNRTLVEFCRRTLLS